VKNFFAITLLSLGTPMLLMGDEVRRTQRGNNNAYCQDNEISWFDWTLLDRHRDVHRFVKILVDFRLRRDLSREETGLSLNQFLRQGEIHWHGVKVNKPDWRDESHSLAGTARSLTGRYQLHCMLNAYWEPLLFELPPAKGLSWHRLLDTFREPPDDICDLFDAPALQGPTYVVQPRSVVLLASRLP
jgi:isoamylase